MSLLEQIIMQKRAERAAENRAPALQSLIGVPGMTAQIGGPESLVSDIQAASGIQALPVDQQPAAFAAGVSQIPGLQSTGISMMERAVADSADAWRTGREEAARMNQTENHFTRRQRQDQNQFDIQEQRRVTKQQFDMSVAAVRHVEDVQSHVLALALHEDKLQTSKLTREQKQDMMDKAAIKMAQISPTMQAELFKFTDKLIDTRDMLRMSDGMDWSFRAGKSESISNMKRWNFMTSEQKTTEGQLRKAFWEREQTYQDFHTNDLSGATVGVEEYERLKKTFILSTDTNADIRRKLTERARLQDRRLRLRRDVIFKTTGGARDISDEFPQLDFEALDASILTQPKVGTGKRKPPRDDTGMRLL